MQFVWLFQFIAPSNAEVTYLGEGSTGKKWGEGLLFPTVTLSPYACREYLDGGTHIQPGQLPCIVPGQNLSKLKPICHANDCYCFDFPYFQITGDKWCV